MSYMYIFLISRYISVIFKSLKLVSVIHTYNTINNCTELNFLVR